MHKDQLMREMTCGSGFSARNLRDIYSLILSSLQHCYMHAKQSEGIPLDR